MATINEKMNIQISQGIVATGMWCGVVLLPLPHFIIKCKSKRIVEIGPHYIHTRLLILQPNWLDSGIQYTGWAKKNAPNFSCNNFGKYGPITTSPQICCRTTLRKLKVQLHRYLCILSRISYTSDINIMLGW